MNTIISNKLENELIYKDTVILKYSIEYPEITVSSYEFGKCTFNNYNKMKAFELEKYCIEELFKEAKQIYDYNMANGYPVMVYEVVKNYNVTYNNNNIVSIYTDQYMFTGGAHGNTIRESQNWNLQICRQIPLEYLYPNNPYYAINILKEINTQIQEQINSGTNYYFDNYCQLVLETFRLENFYIIPNGIEIFFQQYDIAPYSSGIPIFKITTF